MGEKSIYLGIILPTFGTGQADLEIVAIHLIDEIGKNANCLQFHSRLSVFKIKLLNLGYIQ
jgi:hypothetical protein